LNFIYLDIEDFFYFECSGFLVLQIKIGSKLQKFMFPIGPKLFLPNMPNKVYSPSETFVPKVEMGEAYLYLCKISKKKNL